MSTNALKHLLFGSLVAAAAIAAPALRAEPPPFPNPAPKDPPAQKPIEPPVAGPDGQPAPDAKELPPPAPKDTSALGNAPAPGSNARAADPFLKDLHWTRWTGQALKFEQARFLGEARLYARSKERAGWQVFRGPDLDTILRASPSLAAHPEIGALREHLAGPTEVRVVVQGYTLGYEQDPESGEARVFGRGPNGETMWSGADVAAIALENPDLVKVQEWPAFEARVREVVPAASTVRVKPGLSGVAVITYSPRDVSVALHWWRERGWLSRTFRGTSLQQVAQMNTDVARVLDLGDAATAPASAPTPYPLSPTPTPPAAPQPATPRATEPPPTPRYQPPSTPPAGGGGTACGGGGKACGGTR